MKREIDTIIINNPGPKMQELIKRMRVHKQKKREELKNIEPLFVLQ